MQKNGELIAEILDDDLAVTDSETSIELNFAVLKFKMSSRELSVIHCRDESDVAQRRKCL